MATTFSQQQSQYFAHLLTLRGCSELSLSRSLTSARVEMNPHQVDAALFALHSPLTRGAILADEVGLGKTIEASLVISEYWARRKRKVLLIVPASLRKQWQAELFDKFRLPSKIVEGKSLFFTPSDPPSASGMIQICSYEFAARRTEELANLSFDLVVFDEAHKLRNVYKKDGAQRAVKLRTAFQSVTKLLLTATPLQNSLMELYGLVSIIDEHFFGDDQAFRVQFSNLRRNESQYASLKARLSKICKRTLRRQVQEAGLINFTRRYLMTEDYSPSDEEQDLYDLVSSYLQRSNLLAIREQGRHLVALVIRKILASSSVAIAKTLNKMWQRLETAAAVRPSELDDYESLDDLRDELEFEDLDEPSYSTERDRLLGEAKELRLMADLALGIKDNAKANALLRVLPAALREVEARGGARKALIFTESRRTQDYLSNLLNENGYLGQIVLLNGSNSDIESQTIYSEWLCKHHGSDYVSGSKSSDMKQALVDWFKTGAAIMIATESGAEGINLQFCCLVINYDLPWNPQRIEQRIGRCHRYNQKNDVCVVNFINRRNKADQRVHELLGHKFKLFEGVFGASDGVLGEIESGVDIEQRILAIYQMCRTDEEIERAFDDLQASKSDEIAALDASAREALLASVDRTVIEALRWRKDDTTQRLSDYEALLSDFTRAELDGATFHSRQHFEYEQQHYCSDWSVADQMGWHFYRISEGELASELIDRAKGRSFEPNRIAFHYEDRDSQGQLSDVKLLKGQCGWIQLSLLSFSGLAEDRDYLILAGLTSEEHAVIEPETCRRMLMLRGEITSDDPGTIPGKELDEIKDDLLLKHKAEADDEIRRYLDDEGEKLEAWADDVIRGYDAKIRALGSQIRILQKDVRSCSNLEERVDKQRAVKRLQTERRNMSAESNRKQEELEQKQQELLDDVEGRLRRTVTVTQLFQLAWTVN